MSVGGDDPGARQDSRSRARRARQNPARRGTRPSRARTPKRMSPRMPRAHGRACPMIWSRASCGARPTWKAASPASPIGAEIPATRCPLSRRARAGLRAGRAALAAGRLLAGAGRPRLGRRRTRDRAAPDHRRRQAGHHRRILRDRRNRHAGAALRRLTPTGDDAAARHPCRRRVRARASSPAWRRRSRWIRQRARIRCRAPSISFPDRRAPATSSRRSCSARTARTGFTSWSSDRLERGSLGALSIASTGDARRTLTVASQLRPAAHCPRRVDYRRRNDHGDSQSNRCWLHVALSAAAVSLPARGEDLCRHRDRAAAAARRSRACASRRLRLGARILALERPQARLGQRRYGSASGTAGTGSLHALGAGRRTDAGVLRRAATGF